jgi:hypothetical protein
MPVIITSAYGETSVGNSMSNGTRSLNDSVFLATIEKACCQAVSGMVTIKWSGIREFPIKFCGIYKGQIRMFDVIRLGCSFRL